MRLVSKLLFIALICSGSLNGQDYNIDFSFALGNPQGSFAQSLDRNAYGVDASVTAKIPNMPVHIGAGFIYQNFGWTERNEYFNSNIHEVDVRVRTTNNMVTPHLLLRLEPAFGRLSPFLEGSVGFNYLYTHSAVINDWDEEMSGTVNYDYITSNFGMGGGLKFRLYEGFDDDGEYMGVALVLRVRRMIGGEALYLREGDLVSTSSGLEYNLSKSRTDLTTFNIGFMLNF